MITIGCFTRKWPDCLALHELDECSEISDGSSYLYIRWQESVAWCKPLAATIRGLHSHEIKKRKLYNGLCTLFKVICLWFCSESENVSSDPITVTIQTIHALSTHKFCLQIILHHHYTVVMPRFWIDQQIKMYWLNGYILTEIGKGGEGKCRDVTHWHNTYDFVSCFFFYVNVLVFEHDITYGRICV